MSPTLRDARAEDLESVREIYNHYVLNSTCTYQLEPETREQRLAWFATHGADHPVVVAEEGEQILAWASLNRFNARAGYDRTVDTSVYVRAGAHRRGLGSTLVTELVRRARALGHHAVLAGVSADQAPSIALHEALGFREVARFREVGFKFGRWLDVVWFQKLM